MKTLFNIGKFDLTSLFDNWSNYKDVIVSWFTYDSNNPMLFNSALFLGFFLVFYCIYLLTREHRVFRNYYVIAFSLFFYYKAGGMFFLLIFGSGVINYYLSVILGKSDNLSIRRLYLFLAVVGNLIVLGYYKYTKFIVLNLNTIFHSDINVGDIILPIGISFYTFQAISYAVDLYRREIEPAKNLLDFTFYLCFFPQIVAGPIVRAKEFLPQLYKKLTLTKEDASSAIFLILIGLFKKAVISDYISSNFVDRIFDSPLSYTPFENLMGVYGYTLQIYCDFSGYSDMAIGLALLMGFTLPINFRTPYKSQSVTEFWRRWHISLSSWLRDYLYIPLGGNRKGKFRTYINLFLTMLIGGLWHGASWTFVVWGGLHGVMLAIERFFKQYIKIPENRLTRVICIIFTFHFVAFCWIFFKAKSFTIAGQVISTIAKLTYSPNDWITILEGYKNVFILVAIGYCLHFLPEKLVEYIKTTFNQSSLMLKGAVMGIIFWLVYATMSSEPQPFIYFQF